MEYKVRTILSIPERANKRFASLSLHETKHQGYRTIGGDRGDLHFKGFTLEGNSTQLNDPILMSHLELTQDEVDDIALEVLLESYEAIGTETVEHS